MGFATNDKYYLPCKLKSGQLSRWWQLLRQMIDKFNMGFGYSVDFVQFFTPHPKQILSVVRSKFSTSQPKFLKSWQTILTRRQLSDVDDRKVFLVNNFIVGADRPQSFIELHKTILHHYHYFFISKKHIDTR